MTLAELKRQEEYRKALANLSSGNVNFVFNSIEKNFDILANMLRDRNEALLYLKNFDGRFYNIALLESFREFLSDPNNKLKIVVDEFDISQSDNVSEYVYEFLTKHSNGNFELRLAGTSFLTENENKFNVAGKSYQILGFNSDGTSTYKCNFSDNKIPGKLREKFNKHYEECSIINI